MPQRYLAPKVKAPDSMREKKNGQFHNAPAFNEGMGGFTSARKLPGDPGPRMKLESGPSAKRGKPI